MKISFFKNSPRYLAAVRILDTVRCLNIDDHTPDGMHRQEMPDGKSVWIIDVLHSAVPSAALHVLTDRSFTFIEPSTKTKKRFRSVPEVQTFLINKFFV